MADHVDDILDQWATERPDLGTLALGVIGRLVRVTQFLELEVDRGLAPFGLNVGEFNVLAALRRNGPSHRLSPSELSDSLMLTSGGMTKRLDALEAQLLIARTPDPSDGRGLLVELTPSGVALTNELVGIHVANEARALDALSVSEQTQLSQLLRKLLIHFEAAHPSRRGRRYRIARRQAQFRT